jgi:SAM-dependent methyltransferase
VQPRRRYLPDSAYPLPKDQEEQGRLDYQHAVMNLTLGNHYVAPLPPLVRTIVDVGTGTGIWAGEMARLFAESVVVGLDVDTALFHATVPTNCLLRQGDVLRRLPLPDQFAGFTHQRFLVLAIPDAQWPQVVGELVRVTQVGGWLELVETDARVQAGGPATAQVFAWLERLRQRRGLQGMWVGRLDELLQQQGVEQIEKQVISLKVGAWGGRAGRMMERDIVTGVQALKEPCCALGVERQTFEGYVQAMAEEWQQAQAFCLISVVYGKRGRP